MFGMHVAAAVCFLIAVILYIFGEDWATGFGTFGFLFEIVAWVIWINTSHHNE